MSRTSVVLVTLFSTTALSTPAVAQRATAPDFKIVYWVDKGKVGDGLRAEIFDVRKREYKQAWDEWAKICNDSGQRKVWIESHNMADVYAQKTNGRTDFDKINHIVIARKAAFKSTPTQWVLVEWVDTPSIKLDGKTDGIKVPEPPKRDELTFDDKSKNGTAPISKSAPKSGKPSLADTSWACVDKDVTRQGTMIYTFKKDGVFKYYYYHNAYQKEYTDEGTWEQNGNMVKYKGNGRSGSGTGDISDNEIRFPYVDNDGRKAVSVFKKQ